MLPKCNLLRVNHVTKKNSESKEKKGRPMYSLQLQSGVVDDLKEAHRIRKTLVLLLLLPGRKRVVSSFLS